MRITRMIESITNWQLQYLVFCGLSLGVVAFIGILYFRNRLLFRRFLGGSNPLMVVFIVVLGAAVLLTILLSRGWFAIYRPGNVRGLLISLGLSTLLGLAMILFDRKVVLPEDMNILMPDALLFYPAIGYVAEILFHVMPITLLLLVATSLTNSMDIEKIVLPCIVAVALIEPVYQTIMGYSRPYPWWVLGYVGLHNFLFNLIQLLIFRRYDFVSMYSFRFFYYMLWHIVWGHLRLQLLF